MSSAIRRFARRVGPLVVVVRGLRMARREYISQKNKMALSRAQSVAIEAYLASHTKPKLHVGAGRCALSGWLNTDLEPQASDIVYLDASVEFPFADQTFDYVFSEHLIEHLTYAEAQSMLREIYRITKPLGKLRISTPDLRMVIGLYSSEKNDMQRRYLEWVAEFGHLQHRYSEGANLECVVVNNFFNGWGHRFIYDAATLQAVMEETGFADISRFRPGDSNDEDLRGVESHGTVIGDEMNRFETMVLEATRPGPDVR